MNIRLHTHPDLERKVATVIGVGHVIVDGVAYSEARELLDDLAYYLDEAHEIDKYHEDDCSYCKAIKRAKELLGD